MGEGKALYAGSVQFIIVFFCGTCYENTCLSIMDVHCLVRPELDTTASFTETIQSSTI